MVSTDDFVDKKANILKSLIPLALSAILFLSSAISTILSIKTFENHSFWVKRTIEIKEKIYQVLYMLTEAETGMRGLLLTQNESFLEPYELALKRLPRILNELQELTASSSEHEHEIDSLQKMINKRFVVFSDELRVINRVKRHENTLAVDDEELTGQLILGKAIQDEIRAHIEGMLAVEERLLASGRQAVEKSSRISFINVFISSVFGIFLIILGAYYLVANYRRSQRYNRLLGEQNVELEKLLAQSRETIKFRSNFLANMSHEIRTPLNAVMGMIFLLKEEVKDIALQKRLGDIEFSSQILLGVINDILDYSKIDAGMLVLEKEPFNLENVFDGVVTLGKQLAVNKDIEFYAQIDSDMPKGRLGDQLRVNQIIINLLSNAIKFTSRGSVTLEIGRDDAGNQDLVKIRVTDTGIGMDDATLEQVLKPFQQADGSVARKYGGTGLGLTIVDRLVALMGGYFEIKSTAGEGTAITVTLPLQAEQLPTVQRDYQHYDFSGLSVLVVDDDDVSRRLLTHSLASFCCKVSTCASGDESVDLVVKSVESGKPYNLVFMDWRLEGGIDGIEATRRIKRACGDQAPVIIIDTAYGEALWREVGDQEIVDMVLVKPITPSTIFNVLVSMFGNDSQRSVAEGDEEKPRNQLKDVNVLLVEDNLLNQEIEKSILMLFGAKVTLAENGMEALNLLTDPTQGFDIILMDLQMPVLDGLETTKIIRKREGWEAIPIIALTANVQKEDIKACYAAGMNAYIAKPVDGDNLIRQMVHLLEKARS